MKLLMVGDIVGGPGRMAMARVQARRGNWKEALAAAKRAVAADARLTDAAQVLAAAQKHLAAPPSPAA